MYVVIGVLALFMASAGAYGMLSSNLIQLEPNQKVPDYSAKLDSLNEQISSINSQVNSLSSQVNSMNSQVGSISNNLTTFDTLKTNLSDIHEKLADLETMKTNMMDIQNKLDSIGNNTSQATSSPASSSGKILVSLDKTTYLPGDTIHISAMGATPLKTAQIQLLDSNGFTLVEQNAWADSTGSILYGLQTSSALLPGQYQVKISSNQATGLQPITIGTSSTSSVPYILTAQTDKGIYSGGDLIRVTGMAQPSSTVTAVMQSASGVSFTSSTTANSDGSYTVLFSTSSSYEAGTWTITVTNLSQTKALSIYIQSDGSSTGSYTFTAKTDKTSYQPGDTIQITGTAQPSSTVTAVMTNPSGNTYSSSTTVNTDGSYTILFSASSSYQTGNWNANVSNLGQSTTLYFTIGTSSSSGSYTFTAQTDKSSYHIGDLVQIEGTTKANSAVTAVIVSPSGTTYNSSTTTNSNGAYVMFFSTLPSYPAGTWYVEVNNLGQSKVLSFTLQ